jgi:acyl-CoA hydrolase
MEINKYEGNKSIATHSFTVFPQDLNYGDTLFGGITMQHMDIAGVKVVRRALYGTGSDGCVTASVDRIDFKKPAFLGDLITMVAEIKTLGKSSIQTKITVTRESQEGFCEEICVANFTFVAMKDKKSYQHGLSFKNLEGKENGK